MIPIRPNHPLRRLFCGLVEQTFNTEVGFCDPALTDYMADLLVSFTHIDHLQAIRNPADRKLEQVAAILAIALEDVPANALDRDRTMYRHIGDYTLFWAGVYPERLKGVSRRPSDVLVDYVCQGKKSYAIVSDLATEDDVPPSSLFRRLSDEFEHCLYGLSLVRRGWEASAPKCAEAGGDLIY